MEDITRTMLDRASIVAKKSSDPVTKVGAVIIADDFIIEGYNKLAAFNDYSIYWVSDKKHKRVIHAEISAISKAAKFGVPIDGGTIYCSLFPCLNCALTIISSGIKKIVERSKYPLDDERFIEPLKRFRECGVNVYIKEWPVYAEV